MDRLIVLRKLDSLRRCLDRIEAKAPQAADALVDDPDLQDVLVLNITRAVQLCVDLAAHLLAAQSLPAPKSMGEAFAQLEEIGLIDSDLALALRKVVGFRNVAVHAYDTLDLQIVHAIATRGLRDLERFAAVVAERSARPGGEAQPPP